MKNQKPLLSLAGILLLVIGFTLGRAFVSYVLDALG
tara:strand:+ start:752 stop:859 length:108 start_codon:yes stop_codon:yes gene_type:complete